MAEDHLNTGSDEIKPPAPPTEIITPGSTDNGPVQNSHPEETPKEVKPQASSINDRDLFRLNVEKMEEEAESNLFKIQALARVIIEKANYAYNKQFCCSEAEAKDFGEEEELTFLNDLERLAEMIIEKVYQVHVGTFA